MKPKRIPNPPHKCVFCGNGGITKEHVWSDWIKALIPPWTEHHEVGSAVVYDEEAKKNIEVPHTIKFRQGGLNKRTVRKVCRDCNGGWMAKIVERSKPYAEALIKDKSVDLTFEAQALLAGWIAIATIMGEYLHGDIVIQEEDRAALFSSKLPPDNWIICIGRYFGKDWFPMHRCHRFGVVWNKALPKPQREIDATPNNFQMTTYCIRTLLVQAFTVHDSLAGGLNPTRIPLGMIRIWPPHIDLIRWPCTCFVGDPLVTAISQDDDNWITRD